jgi:hypothetical protein
LNERLQVWKNGHAGLRLRRSLNILAAVMVNYR